MMHPPPPTAVAHWLRWHLLVEGPKAPAELFVAAVRALPSITPAWFREMHRDRVAEGLRALVAAGEVTVASMYGCPVFALTEVS